MAEYRVTLRLGPLGLQPIDEEKQEEKDGEGHRFTISIIIPWAAAV